MTQAAEIEALRRQVERLTARINNMFAISRSTRDPDDTGPIQTLQMRLSALELHDAVMRVQDYGLASVPPVGTDIMTLFMSGDRGRGIAFAAGNQTSRPRGMGVGDSCLYDSRGHRVQLQDGNILVDANGSTVTVENATTVVVRADTKVRFETPLLEVTGEIRDRCDTDGITAEAFRNLYNIHTHPVPGVQTGGATVTSSTTSNPA